MVLLGRRTAKYESGRSKANHCCLAPTANSFLMNYRMSTLTTPDKLHASRASSSKHSLSTAHVDHDTGSQSKFHEDFSDIKRSEFSVAGSSAPLRADIIYVRRSRLVNGVHSLLKIFKSSSRITPSSHRFVVLRNRDRIHGTRAEPYSIPRHDSALRLSTGICTRPALLDRI